MDERRRRDQLIRRIIMVKTFELLKNHIQKIGYKEASIKTKCSEEYLKDICRRKRLLTKEKIIEMTDGLL